MSRLPRVKSSNPRGTDLSFLSRGKAKYQAPNPKLQRSSKYQTPNPKNRCRGQRRADLLLSSELGAYLELGLWNLELRAGALSSFPKIERRPSLRALTTLLLSGPRGSGLNRRPGGWVSVVGYPSGQRGQTVNLLAHAFAGSNPAPTTTPIAKHNCP